MIAFNITSIIVVLALSISLVYWFKIWKKGTDTNFKKGSFLYVVCFTLYVVGQTSAILQSNGFVEGWYNLSSYCYALAALLFAFGSYYQYQSVVKNTSTYIE
ncbi:MAG: hypothetical protein WDZ93_04160 [Candidatus Paceibacterota bacterium]